MKFRIPQHEQTPLTPQITDVPTFIETHRQQLEAFLEFAERQPNCAGLAANQCEISLDGGDTYQRFLHRVFVYINPKTGKGTLIINPKIIQTIGLSRLCDEGCLTYKGKRIIAPRYIGVRVTYFNMEGKEIEAQPMWFSAQVWQHEIDHLNGVEWRLENENFQLPKQLKLERNEPCPCGTGKKYKNCCISYNQ